MENRFEVRDGYAVILLNRKAAPPLGTKLDIPDLALAQDVNGTWSASGSNGKLYAMASRYERVNGRPKRQISILLHRLIMGQQSTLGVSHKYVVDHINGDTLDNRRVNLRYASPTLNAINRATPTVHQVASGTWQAYIGYKGTRIMLGNFESHESALLVYAGAKLAVESIEMQRMA